MELAGTIKHAITAAPGANGKAKPSQFGSVYHHAPVNTAVPAPIPALRDATPESKDLACISLVTLAQLPVIVATVVPRRSPSTSVASNADDKIVVQTHRIPKPATKPARKFLGPFIFLFPQFVFSYGREN